MNMFKQEIYLETIAKYETHQIKDFQSLKHGILLRHDIDASIDIAYELFEREVDLGIRATYYVLLTSPLYNAFSTHSRGLLRRMASRAEVGLHFDPLVYNAADPLELTALLQKECQMLEDLTQERVASFSMHSPSIHNIYLENTGLLSAYDSRIFSDEIYMSDSCFSFRNKDPESFLQTSRTRLIQVLFHPFHLSGGGGNTYEQPLNKMLSSYLAGLDAAFAPNHRYAATRADYKIRLEDTWKR